MFVTYWVTPHSPPQSGRHISIASKSETTASADGVVGGGGDTTENEAENEDNDNKGSKGSEKPAKDGKAEV